MTALFERRERGDAIQMFKFFEGIDELNWASEQPIHVDREYMRTRGHNRQLRSELVKNCPARYCFYVNRVARGVWNDLSYGTVNAESINSFKSRIDKHKTFFF